MPNVEELAFHRGFQEGRIKTLEEGMKSFGEELKEVTRDVAGLNRAVNKLYGAIAFAYIVIPLVLKLFGII